MDVGRLRRLVRTGLVPAGVGLAFGPSAIVLHEAGHAAAAAATGTEFSLRATSTVVGGHGSVDMTWLLAAGPAVELLLSVAGFMLIVARPRRHGGWPGTIFGWVATAMAALCVRWLTRVPVDVVYGFATGFYSADEALLSEQLGLSPWFLPVVLVAPAAAAMTSLARLHSPGQRLVPFAALFVSEGVGVLLWTFVLSPFALHGA
jgi:hypothetical protein